MKFLFNGTLEKMVLNFWVHKVKKKSGLGEKKKELKIFLWIFSQPVLLITPSQQVKPAGY